MKHGSRAEQKRKEKKRKEKKRKEKKRKEKKRKEKKRKEKKRKEKKRKEKITLFSDHNGSLLRRQPGGHGSIQAQQPMLACLQQPKLYNRWTVAGCSIIMSKELLAAASRESSCVDFAFLS